MRNKSKLKKDKDKDKIINDIKEAQAEIKVAENFFQCVSDPELVDVAIYELEAKRSRYYYLIRLAKERGIRKSLKESLIDALAK